MSDVWDLTLVHIYWVFRNHNKTGRPDYQLFSDTNDGQSLCFLDRGVSTLLILAGQRVSGVYARGALWAGAVTTPVDAVPPRTTEG